MNQIASYIVAIGGVASAIAAVWGLIFGFTRWVDRQNRQSHIVAELEAKHKADIDALKAEERQRNERVEGELCALTRAMLAVLDGLKQKGCNGQVTEAYETLTEHLNQQAHGQK